MFDFIGRALAQDVEIPKIKPLAVGDSVNDFALRAISWFIWAAGALVVIYLIYGGIMYVTAGGDAEKATKGRTAVINAIIGLIIVLLALVIVSWIMTAVKKVA